MSLPKDILVGDLVHVPSAIKLVQEGVVDGTGGGVIVNNYMYSKVPSVGLVVSKKDISQVEVYCYGDKWLVPGGKVFKIN